MQRLCAPRSRRRSTGGTSSGGRSARRFSPPPSGCPSASKKFQQNDHALTGRDGCVRCKDAGSLDSSAIEATEDAAACVPSAFRRPVLILLGLLGRATEEPGLERLQALLAGERPAVL